MVKTTGKKRQGTRKEVIPKGDDFMSKVSYKLLKKVYDKEQPGKPQLILRACLLRKECMGIHKIARTMGQKYSTVRGWLLRMIDADLNRRFDKKVGRRKEEGDVDLANAIGEWLDNPPECYGFAGGTWQLDMIAAMLNRERGVSFHTRKLQRMMREMGFSYTKARPVSAKSATPEEQLEFMNKTNEEIVSLIAQGYAAFFEDEAGVLRWNSGGYGWRRTGSRDTVKTTFSKQSAKLFGVLGESGCHTYPVAKLNSHTFVGFMKKIRKMHKKYVLILDSASYHKSNTVNEFLESAKGDIKLIFLPKYTPQLNAIEIQWRVLKRLLAGRYFETIEELRNAIRQIVRDDMKPVKVMDYITNRY